MTDAGLLAKGTVWAATNTACANQAFNIANGDLFRWDDLWPKLAGYFNIDVAPPLEMSLADVMSDKEELWTSMVSKYALAPNRYSEVSSWRFSDFVFGWDYDVFADGTKARRHGFHEYVDTEQMFFRIFDELKKARVIPGESK
jgi:hypothetical protein